MIESLRHYTTKINKTLSEDLDEKILSCCRISNIILYGATRYGGNLDEGKIKIN